MKRKVFNLDDKVCDMLVELSKERNTTQTKIITSAVEMYYMISTKQMVLELVAKDKAK